MRRPPRLEGQWQVEATVPGGGAYTGRVTARRAGGILRVEWEITAGRYAGIGLARDEAWYVACGEDGVGLGVALLEASGRVRWAPAPVPGGIGEGRLDPVGPHAWRAGPGSPQGLPFGSISLSGVGEVVEATLGGPGSRALGLSFPGGWALAWYPRFEELAVLRYTAGEEAGTVQGLWALGGRGGTAAERLRRPS